MTQEQQKSVVGWAVLDKQGRVDCYYHDLETAKGRARHLAQTHGEVVIAEMVKLVTIRAHRGPWTYTEEEPGR